MHADRGFSLVDLILAMTVMAMGALILVPPLMSGSARLRVDMAAHELMGALREARMKAIEQGANVGLKLYPEAGRVGFALYRDGDGDGVRTADIASGVDPAVTPVRYFAHMDGKTGFGFPPDVRPRDPGDPGRRLDLSDPVRFNNSDLASFSPLGASTPGSLYLTDGHRELMVVRLLGMTGRIHRLRWDATTDTWK